MTSSGQTASISRFGSTSGFYFSQCIRRVNEREVGFFSEARRITEEEEEKG